MIGRQWTALTVRHLEAGPLRHGELLGRMCGVSQKTLTERLRELERHQAVRRERLPGSVPGARYSLTPRGHALARLLAELEEWGAKTLPASMIVSPPTASRTLRSAADTP